MNKVKATWIRYKDEKPEKGRLFLMREIGTVFNTNWKLKVWSTDTVRDTNTSNAEYLYID